MNGIQMNRFYISLSFFLLIASYCSAQESFRVMFYNVENLYDTINNPQTLDDEFTPQGSHRWNTYRYQKKLEDVAKVISSLGSKQPPALAALCEVENATVLNDLTLKSALARHKYRYINSKSKDPRGSNVALLYQRDQFRLINHRSYTPKLKEGKATRDILHVTGLVVSGDTLDLFVCHFPSRSEGIAKSELNRIAVAQLLRKRIDLLLKQRTKAHIIIMGDFNDLPIDTSMKDVLKALPLTEEYKRDQLYNLFLSPEGDIKKIKSYKHKGKWMYMDQLICNGLLFDKENSIHLTSNGAEVFHPDFLLEEDTKYGGHKPFRTYSGWSYLGGISDHLPIYLDLYIKELIIY